MCPECFTTAAMIFAGATSTGGLGALVMKKLGFKELSRFAKSPDEPTQNQAQENSMPEVLASTRIADHKIVSPDQWLEHRKQLLAKEKELTRLRDEINRAAAGTALGESRETVHLRKYRGQKKPSPTSSPEEVS